MPDGRSMNVIQRTFQRLCGQPCWGVEHGSYLALEMNFGTPSLDVREPRISRAKSAMVRRLMAKRWIRVQGQWQMWVLHAYWRLSIRGELVARSSSALRQKRQGVAELDGQKLLDMQLNAETGATQFWFDLGGLLEVRRWRRDSCDQLWVLHKPNGYALSVNGNGTYNHGPRSRSDKRQRVVQRVLTALPWPRSSAPPQW